MMMCYDLMCTEKMTRDQLSVAHSRPTRVKTDMSEKTKKTAEDRAVSPVGRKVEELWRKRFVEKMSLSVEWKREGVVDGDNGDKENDELISVNSDKSGRYSRSTGWRSSLMENVKQSINVKISRTFCPVPHTDLSAELCGLFKAGLRYEHIILGDGADRFQRVAERAECVERDVVVDRRLIKDANTARLWKAIGSLGLLYKFVENGETSGWVAATGENAVVLTSYAVT